MATERETAWEEGYKQAWREIGVVLPAAMLAIAYDVAGKPLNSEQLKAVLDYFREEQKKGGIKNDVSV